MRTTANFILPVAVALCLAGCGSGTERAAETIDKAEGEILSRSVTDDMLPYESLRSQPPLEVPAGETSQGGQDSAGKEGEAESSPIAPETSAAAAKPVPAGQSED